VVDFAVDLWCVSRDEDGDAETIMSASRWRKWMWLLVREDDGGVAVASAEIVVVLARAWFRCVKQC